MRYVWKVLLPLMWLWSAGCQDEVVVPVTASGRLAPREDSTAIPFSDIMNLTVGVQEFRNVTVLGTLRYNITKGLDSTTEEDSAAAKLYNVFIHVEITFRRSQDFTMDQHWKAEGKSGKTFLMNDESLIVYRKSYRIWSIPNEAYMNVIFHITPSSVDVQSLWVSYEQIPDA